jgi:DNA-binding winged helix-turn-helix (wHTH) protein
MDMDASLDPQVRLVFTSWLTDASPMLQSVATVAEAPPCSPTDSIIPPGEVQSEDSGGVFTIGQVRLDCSRRSAFFNGRSVRLSRLDCALLLALGRSKNRMLSYSRIIRRVWGPTGNVSPTGLRVRIFHLRHKLEALRVDGVHIRNKDRIGYIMEVDEQTSRDGLKRRNQASQIAILRPRAANRVAANEGAATAAE